MEIVPDAKDWTWVLERRCPECGLDTREITRASIATRIRSAGDEWVAVLLETEDAAARPDPAVWSPLEYGCHVRDVFRLFDTRLQKMLTENDPLYPNWDQDATAVEDRYGEQDPRVVAGELREAAGVLADRFDSVAGDQWQRTGRRGDGAHFTVETFGRYLIHDPTHHLWDVRGGRHRADGGEE